MDDLKCFIFTSFAYWQRIEDPIMLIPSIGCFYQVQELEAEFEKMPNEKPQQSRFMRSQQDLKAKMEEKAAAAAGNGGGDVGEDDEGRGFCCLVEALMCCIITTDLSSKSLKQISKRILIWSILVIKFK